MNIYKFIVGTRVIRIAAVTQEAARECLMVHKSISDAMLESVSSPVAAVMLTNSKYEAPKRARA